MLILPPKLFLLDREDGSKAGLEVFSFCHGNNPNQSNNVLLFLLIPSTALKRLFVGLRCGSSSRALAWQVQIPISTAKIKSLFDCCR
jgi:hypothetical protein